MLIYAVADIHGRTSRMEAIGENIVRYKPQALIVAGDITRFTNRHTTLSLLNSLPVPVLIVRGNSDPHRMDGVQEKYHNIYSLHMQRITLDGVDFTGVSGAIPVPFRSRMRLKEWDLLKKLEPLVDKKTVLVTHPPPRGKLDEVLWMFSVGSKKVEQIVSALQPGLAICGHIHERPGTAFIDNTLVVNCSMGKKGAGALIEITNNNNRKVEMLSL